MAGLKKSKSGFVRTVTALGISLLGIPGYAAAAPYFTQTDDALISPAGFRSVMPTACPHDNSEPNYLYYPQTVCLSKALDYLHSSTWTGGSFDYLLWANRYAGGPNKRPNPLYPVVQVSGLQCRAQFSTVAYADGATLGQASYFLGYPAHDGSGHGYLDETEAAGIPDGNVISWATFSASPATYCTASDGTFSLTTDYVILPEYTVADIGTTPVEGISVDFEVQDGHSPTQTSALVAELATLTHGNGYKLSFYTNPLDGTEEPYNGIVGTGNVGENTDNLLSNVDYFDLLLYHPNNEEQELTAELSQFKAPVYSKFQVTWDLQSAPADAAAIRSSIIAYGFAGVVFLIDGVKMGNSGSCSDSVNRQIGYMTGLLGLDTCPLPRITSR